MDPAERGPGAGHATACTWPAWDGHCANVSGTTSAKHLQGETLPFGPTERPMAGYVGLPIQDAPTQSGSGARALVNVSAMPPKAAKSAKPKKG